MRAPTAAATLRVHPVHPVLAQPAARRPAQPAGPAQVLEPLELAGPVPVLERVAPVLEQVAPVLAEPVVVLAAARSNTNPKGSPRGRGRHTGGLFFAILSSRLPLRNMPLANAKQAALATQAVSMFGQHRRGDQLQDQGKAKRNDNQVVQLAEHRNEIGNQIDRRNGIGNDGQRERLCIPRCSRITGRRGDRAHVPPEFDCPPFPIRPCHRPDLIPPTPRHHRPSGSGRRLGNANSSNARVQILFGSRSPARNSE